MTKIAILGAGRWGVHLIRNFLEHPLSELMAVIDPQPERLTAVRQRLHLPAEVILATDGSVLQDLPELEAVAIATPASTHYPLIVTALQQGYHVFTEKPLTLNLSEAREVCQLAEKQQRQLFVDHTYLFHPAIERGKTAIQAGQLGTLRYGYAQRTHLEPVRWDVDALWDLAIHDIAIFNTWLGEVPSQVQATGTAFKHNLQPQNPELATISPFPFYDLVWATLTYPSGFQAFIHLCWLNPDKQRRLTLVGSQAALVFDELSGHTPLTLHHPYREGGGGRNPELTSSAPWKVATSYQEVLAIEPSEPLRRVCDHFLNCLQKNCPSPLSSGWASVELIRILSALSESLKLDGKTISLEQP